MMLGRPIGGADMVAVNDASIRRAQARGPALYEVADDARMAGCIAR
jgi:hypothetical protein